MPKKQTNKKGLTKGQVVTFDKKKLVESPSKPKPTTSAKPKKPLPPPRSNIKKADYVYALEVAFQPAPTPKDKKIRRQAKADVKYLEQKFPKYTDKMKNFNTRHNINK
jgi:hypothetical protein